MIKKGYGLINSAVSLRSLIMLYFYHEVGFYIYQLIISAAWLYVCDDMQLLEAISKR